jgi:predicted nucleotidyltransferase
MDRPPIAPGIVLPEAEIAEICRRYEIRKLAVFGSAARGELRPDSDVDLLVEFLPDAKVSLLRHAAAEREFSGVLGRKVDLVSKRALRDSVKEEVLLQARRIYAA